MVLVFRELWRVLRDDGVAWLNLGDSYANSSKGSIVTENSTLSGSVTYQANGTPPNLLDKTKLGLPAKNLLGIPWRVAFALQADGWYLRSDVIWAKKNGLPESCKDRPTKAHEYLFLLAKGQRKTSIIKLSDLHSEFVHFSYNFGFKSSNSGASIISISLASAILDAAQFKYNLSLSPFDSQVRLQGINDFDSPEIVSLPPIRRAAILAFGFLYGNISTKDFLQQLQRFGIAHGDSNTLLIGGGSIEISLSPSIYSDREGTLTVHNSGQISKFDFIHSNIIIQKPSSGNYWYDQDAIREPQVTQSLEEAQKRAGKGGAQYDRWEDKNGFRGIGGLNKETKNYNPQGRNRRTVWSLIDAIAEHNELSAFTLARLVSDHPELLDSILDEYGATTTEKSDIWELANKPYKDAHFAVFPPALVEPCILAGCPSQVCAECGEPWVRVVEKIGYNNHHGINKTYQDEAKGRHGKTSMFRTGQTNKIRSVAFTPVCVCAAPHRPGIVLDPFFGSGTVGEVAIKNKRGWLGIELNAEYVKLAEKRIGRTQPALFAV
jgi:DNA modification methylase